MFPVAAGLALWELFWWEHRRTRRGVAFDEARELADELGRPLVVVGAPDRGSTSGYPCGDITIDIAPSSCPGAIQADITRRLPFDDDSVVVFESCVLEYVDDAEAAQAELARISGGRLFQVRVEPWTVTAYAYPGTRRQL